VRSKMKRRGMRLGASLCLVDRLKRYEPRRGGVGIVHRHNSMGAHACKAAFDRWWDGEALVLVLRLFESKHRA
jgi:hypothetical protein